jgi:hypothetical protein
MSAEADTINFGNSGHPAVKNACAKYISSISVFGPEKNIYLKILKQR